MEILSTHMCYFFLNFGVNYRHKRNNFSKKGTYLEWTRLTEEYSTRSSLIAVAQSLTLPIGPVYHKHLAGAASRN